jgi:hypothetical protein
VCFGDPKTCTTVLNYAYVFSNPRIILINNFNKMIDYFFFLFLIINFFYSINKGSNFEPNIIVNETLPTLNEGLDKDKENYFWCPIAFGARPRKLQKYPRPLLSHGHPLKHSTGFFYNVRYLSHGRRFSIFPFFYNVRDLSNERVKWSFCRARGGKNTFMDKPSYKYL